MHKTSIDNFAAARKGGIEAQLALLMDREEITDVVQRYGHSTDTLNFALYRSCFTDTIEMHFGGTVSVERTTYSADEWVELARKFHTQLDGRQHLLVPEGIVINGDSASCYVLLQARHYKKGSPFQLINGHYLMDFSRTKDGWKICKATQKVEWGDGNWQIHSDAAKVFDKNEFTSNSIYFHIISPLKI